MENKELICVLEAVIKELKGAKTCTCKQHVVEVPTRIVADIPTAEANDNFDEAEIEEDANELAKLLSDKELVTLFLCLNTEIIERGLTKQVLEKFMSNKGER